jgi:glucokinase
MTESTELEMIETKNFKQRLLILGAVIGALTGLGAAYLISQRIDEDENLKLSAGEGVKLGISVFAFFRQIIQLGD